MVAPIGRSMVKSVRVAPIADGAAGPFAAPGAQTYHAAQDLAKLHAFHWKQKAKTSAAHRVILANAPSIPALSKLPADALGEIADVMERQPFVKGDIVFTEGEEGTFFYIVESGTFEATGGDGQVVPSYSTKLYFGEVALLQMLPRPVTVTCTSSGQLWRIGRSAFRRAVITLTLHLSAEKISLLANLEPDVLDELADEMFEVPCQVGDVVIRQGDVRALPCALAAACVCVLASAFLATLCQPWRPCASRRRRAPVFAAVCLRGPLCALPLIW